METDTQIKRNSFPEHSLYEFPYKDGKSVILLSGRLLLLPIRVVPRVQPRPYLFDGGVAFVILEARGQIPASSVTVPAFGFRAYSAGFTAICAGMWTESIKFKAVLYFSVDY